MPLGRACDQQRIPAGLRTGCRIEHPGLRFASARAG
jgi:hypothetical protein